MKFVNWEEEGVVHVTISFFLFIYWFLLYNLIGYEEKDQGGKFKGNAGKYHYH